jgi:zinc-binding alcohol dehydrogenase/oxidoreductase
MRGCVFNGKNQPITLQELPDPLVRAGEAIVQIRAAALNHRDLWIQKGLYAGLQYPIVPGSDGAGIVHALGDPSDWLGRKVIVNPSLHWGTAETHQDPAGFRILGMPDPGTFAEYVSVPMANLAELPPHLSFEEAAALPLAGLTAFRALFARAGLKSGEKILITGIGGGVALFGLQFALAAGARVFVSSGSEEKINRAMALGAEAGVNYQSPAWADQLRNLAGSMDIIVDGAAGPQTNQLLDLAGPGGRIVFYGATRGDAGEISMRRIFWKQINILGSTMGSPEDFQHMMDFVNSHALRPVIDQVFPMGEAEKALRRMDSGSQFGKIVLQIS